MKQRKMVTQQREDQWCASQATTHQQNQSSD